MKRSASRLVEERRVERVERLNDQAVRSITQSLVSLQSEYDQAVIGAIQKAEQHGGSPGHRERRL